MRPVFYLCDRQACERCNPECKHTPDILHAKSFQTEYGISYWEKERDELVSTLKYMQSRYIAGSDEWVFLARELLYLSGGIE